MLRIFFPPLYQSETQHAPGCLSMHQGAYLRPSTYQHASSSPTTSNVVSIGVYGGTSGWSLVCSKKGPFSRQPRKQGATTSCDVSRQGVWVQVETLKWEAECGPLLTRLGQATPTVVSGAGLRGQYMNLLILQVYLCRRSRISRLRMTIRRLSLAVLQEGILKMFSVDD